jgi:hypothetical protein
MQQHSQLTDVREDDEAPYEAPLVDDLDSVDGPAVTAAANSVPT